MLVTKAWSGIEGLWFEAKDFGPEERALVPIQASTPHASCIYSGFGNEETYSKLQSLRFRASIRVSKFECLGMFGASGWEGLGCLLGLGLQTRQSQQKVLATTTPDAPRQAFPDAPLKDFNLP